MKPFLCVNHIQFARFMLRVGIKEVKDIHIVTHAYKFHIFFLISIISQEIITDN